MFFILFITYAKLLLYDSYFAAGIICKRIDKDVNIDSCIIYNGFKWKKPADAHHLINETKFIVI